MTKKTAQLESYWPQLYQKLKAPPPGVNLGSLPGKLPPANRVFFDRVAPSDNPNAIAYVSTEDADRDGKLDSMHFVVPNLERALRESGADLTNLTDVSNLFRLLTIFGEVISHELGHIADYRPEQQQPFPGGEGVADSAARQALREITFHPTAKAATNIENSHEHSGRFMMNSVLKKLAEMANDLDKRGHTDVSDRLDSVIVKLSQEVDVPMTGAREQWEKAKAGKPGSIQPKEYPGFTYDYLPNQQQFIIRTAPDQQFYTVGKLIRPDSNVHKVLMEKYGPKEAGGEGPVAAEKGVLSVIPPSGAPQPLGRETVEHDIARAEDIYRRKVEEGRLALSKAGFATDLLNELTGRTRGVDPADVLRRLQAVPEGSIDRLPQHQLNAAAEVVASIAAAREQYYKQKNLLKKLEGTFNQADDCADCMDEDVIQVAQETVDTLSKLAKDMKSTPYGEQINSLLEQMKVASEELKPTEEPKIVAEASEEEPTEEETAPVFKVQQRGPFGRD